MKLLQICNVGQIIGGTGACAWTICQALAEMEHVVWFRTPPTTETVGAFAEFSVAQGGRFERKDYERLQPDLILLHNTPAAAVFWGLQQPEIPCVVIQYQHSQTNHLAGCDQKVLCSRWLQQRPGNSGTTVLWQGVPLPVANSARDDRCLLERLRVGRICTPITKKWPATVLDFYAELDQLKLPIDWEFVGCPENMQPALRKLLGEQVTFYAAGWQARQHLHRWHGLLYSQPEVTESFGRVCAEAMRCGAVPIVDRQGGFIEQLPEGTGFLCDNRQAFAITLQQLTDPANWKTHSRACREWAENQFSIQAFRHRLLKLFQNVVL